MITNKYNIVDYINAPSGFGPLQYVWEDKPHRLVYDLVVEIRRLNKELNHE